MHLLFSASSQQEPTIPVQFLSNSLDGEGELSIKGCEGEFSYKHSVSISDRIYECFRILMDTKATYCPSWVKVQVTIENGPTTEVYLKTKDVFSKCIDKDSLTTPICNSATSLKRGDMLQVTHDIQKELTRSAAKVALPLSDREVPKEEIQRQQTTATPTPIDCFFDDAIPALRNQLDDCEQLSQEICYAGVDRTEYESAYKALQISVTKYSKRYKELIKNNSEILNHRRNKVYERFVAKSNTFLQENKPL